MGPKPNDMFISFSRKKVGRVDLYFTKRLPEEDWLKARIKSLRKVDGIERVTCLPGSYELRARVARSYYVEDALAAIISAAMDLTGIESVHDLVIYAKRNKLTLTDNDLLVEALEQLANSEWMDDHAQKLQVARKVWTRHNERVSALTSSYESMARDERRLAGDLELFTKALASARNTYEGDLKTDPEGTAEPADHVVDVVLGQVATCEQAISVLLDRKGLVLEELATTEDALEAAQVALEDLQGQSCPNFSVNSTTEGKVVVFTFTLDPNDEEELDPEGDMGDEVEDSNPQQEFQSIIES